MNIINKNKDGYGYKYTDLAEINKYCETQGITYYQEIETNESNLNDYIITTIIKDGKETKYRGCKIVDAVLSGIKNPVQEYGSSLTYCRRYSLLMALGLATDDDDAQCITRPIINSKEEAENYKLTFGKYTGKTLKEVPENYLQWLVENSKDETIKTACDYLVKHITSKDYDLFDEFKRLESETDTNHEEILEYFKVESDSDMTKEQIEEAIKILKKKLGGK